MDCFLSRQNKKAQDVNLLFVVIITLVIAISVVVGYKITKQINTNVQNFDVVSQDSKNMMQNVTNNYVTIWDMLFLVIFVFMIIILVASAFFIDTHPIFFILTALMTIITAFVGGHLANAYSSFADTAAVSTEASSFVIIPYIFKHYIAIISVVGFMVSIALYAKLKGTQ